MKSWLRKLFYLDDPAQEAFFALTLWAVGSYWLFTLLAVAGDLGAFYELMTFSKTSFSMNTRVLLLGLFLLFLYSLIMTLRVLDRSFGHRHAVWIGFGAVTLWLYLFNVLFPGLDPQWNLVVVAAFGIFMLVSCGRGAGWALGAMASLITGCFMILLPLGYPLPFETLVHFAEPCPPPRLIAVQRFFGLAGYGWTLWTAIGLALFLAAYLCSAKLLAGLGNRSIRSLFNRPVIALLLSAGVIHLTFLVMVFFANQECTGAVAALERHFGRPVSAAALKQFYYGGKAGDSAYWNRLNACKARFLPSIEEDHIFYDEQLASISGSDFKRLRDHWMASADSFRETELMFSGPIPPPVLDFPHGELMMMELPQYGPLRAFCWRELWAIRLLLADGDVKAALTAYDRIDRVNRFLLQDVFLIGAIVWCHSMDIQLDALQMLLESGSLSEQQLQRLNRDLAEFEAGAADLHARCLYGEAVQALDFFVTMAEGRWHFPGYGDYVSPMPPQAVRFFVPQLWWAGLRAEAEAARCFLITDLKQLPTREDREKISLLVREILSPPTVGVKFDMMIGRLRAMRGLIAAEVYKRQNGDYSDAMPDLPLDPFSGKPLLYRKGICPYRLTRIKWEADPDSASGGRWERETSDTEIPAIQVWSVGPDRVDNGGYRDHETKADDVGAMLRLKP